MKWIILLFTIKLMVVQTLFSQIENGDKPLYTWKYFVDRDVEALSLEVLDSTNYRKVYRIWRGFQVVELIQVNDSIYKGQIVNYVTQRKGNGKKEKSEVISHKTLLPKHMVESLMEQLTKENIVVLPDSKEIARYPQGLDGITYNFEVVGTGTSYRMYSYWSPESDYHIGNNLPKVKQVRNILQALNQYVDLGKHFSVFLDRLPLGEYRYGCIVMKKF